MRRWPCSTCARCTWGPGLLVVAARVDLRDDVEAAEIERLSDAVDRELRDTVPSVRRVFLDATAGRRAATAGRRAAFADRHAGNGTA